MKQRSLLWGFGVALTLVTLGSVGCGDDSDDDDDGSTGGTSSSGGTSGESGYSKNIKVMVLQTGPSRDWKVEKRNVYEDYVTLFGKEPSFDIGAIAFMTDADSTKTTADAVYDEIKIGYETI